MTADEIRALLKLEPHATCEIRARDFHKRNVDSTWWTAATLAEGHPAGSALCFMVTPDAPVRLSAPYPL